MRTVTLLLTTAVAVTSVVTAPTASISALSQEIEQFDVVAPPGSSDFGDDVTVLANGNYVVVDAEFDSPTAVEVGAVHLYDGRTDQLISTLTGSTAGDEVGADGIEELDDERFAVFSPQWGHPDGTPEVGAVTIVDATTGLDGVVTVSNSLHGSSAGDQVGDRDDVLDGGRLLVLSPEWDHPDGTVDVGAATLVDGAGPITGPVTVANSLHGTQAGDRVGLRAVALTTGDYVVSSDDWNHPDGTQDVGAATQADGQTGITGPVTVANSLHGTQTGDSVGNRVFPLTNGNHVIASPSWSHPDGTSDVGAVTWVDGSAGLTGPVTVDNSLHGSSTDDHIGSNPFADEAGDVEVLTNGNYVVPSLRWDAPDGTVNVGAVTWADGTTGIAGPVTLDNSLHGTAAQDGIGARTLPLTNGNFVAASRFWNHPDGTINVGAVTWGDGSAGITGPVTSANSLHGETANDDVGFSVEPLANGNYVVPSEDWDHPDGTVDVGAATWGDGTTGIVGPVSPANSLHGTSAGDHVGDYFETIALTNGNYVVASIEWSDPAGAADVGAATWADGTTGLVGPVTVDNSLHGTTAGDEVGDSIDPLLDGNYVVRSRDWDHPDGTVDVGAATWGDGTVGTAGPVTVDNSAHGSTAGDAVGRVGFQAFDDGSYAVTAEDWDDPDGPVVDAGAVLFGLPNGATTGPLTRQNSVVGTPPGEVDRAAPRITAGDSIVVETEQLRVLVMRLDRPPFFPVGAPDITVATAPGADGAVVDFDTPIADDVRSDVVVACAPASGSTFPVGATEVTCTATDAGGQTAATAFDVIVTATPVAPLAPDESDVTAVDPERVLDTRPGFDTVDGRFAGGGRVAAGSEIEVQIAGRGGIPDDADAAFLNVTADLPDATGFVTVHPCEDRPNASNVNYAAGDTAPNAVLAKLSPTGTVCIFTLASSHLIVDTAGFVPTGGSTTAVDPSRLLDSRAGFDTDDGRFAGTGRVAGGAFVEVQVAGRGGVPDDAVAAFLNVTADRPDDVGFLTVFPCTADRPNASNVNYAAGDTAPNAVLAKLSPTGTVCVFSLASTDLVVDVNGFTPPDSSTTPVEPQRILETRDGFTTADGLFEGVGRVAGGTEIEVQVAGRGGIPADADAAFLNVTADRPDGVGFLTVHPCGVRPNASNVNYATGETAPNAVLAKLSPTGTVCIFTLASSHVIVDTAGFTRG